MKVTRHPFDPGPAVWNRLLPPALRRPTLESAKTADVVVIGGGFAGLSAALRLRQLDMKLKIVVLEARQIAEGPAGRNSGFMIDLPHHLASKDYAGSMDSDREQTALNREAIAFAADAAAEFAMSEEAFAISGKINAAATAKGMAHNLDYARHLTDLGEQHEMLDSEAMYAICGSRYYRSGLFTPGTAMIQPALYIRNLAAGIEAKDIQIFENSTVTEMTKTGNDWLLKTDKGSVTTHKVVLATNGHVESFGFFKRRLIHIYLYGSMTRPLTGSESKALGGQKLWGFTPADPMGTSVRKISGTGGERILVRNRFTWAPDRTVSERKLGGMARVHERAFAKRFPQLEHVNMDFCWGGLLCLSWNTVPAFGELEHGLYSACCQNGLGTTMGTLSGKLTAELLLGKTSSSLASMLAKPKPKRLPPEPLSSIGANITMRWGEFKARKEL